MTAGRYLRAFAQRAVMMLVAVACAACAQESALLLDRLNSHSDNTEQEGSENARSQFADVPLDYIVFIHKGSAHWSGYLHDEHVIAQDEQPPSRTRRIPLTQIKPGVWVASRAEVGTATVLSVGMLHTLNDVVTRHSYSGLRAPSKSTLMDLELPGVSCGQCVVADENGAIGERYVFRRAWFTIELPVPVVGVESDMVLQYMVPTEWLTGSGFWRSATFIGAGEYLARINYYDTYARSEPPATIRVRVMRRDGVVVHEGEAQLRAHASTMEAP